MYSIQYKFGWVCQITLQKDHLRFPLSPAVSEHLFATALKHQAVMREASSRPGPPGQIQGKAIAASTSLRPGRPSSDGCGLPTVCSSHLWSSLYTALGPWPWKLLGGLLNSSLMQYLLWWGLVFGMGSWKESRKGEPLKPSPALPCPHSWIIRNWYPSLTCPQLSSWRTMVSAGSPRTRTCECPSPSTSSWKPTAPEPPLLLVLSQGSFSRP